MFDLHVHTTASDGEFSPKEIVNLALKNEVSTIAIADHDTVDGLQEAIEEGKKIGVEVIPAVELNAHIEKGKMHILGYYMDYNDPNFKNKMEEFKRDRNERNQKFIEEFNKQNINISIEDVKKYAFGEILAKPHFTRALLEKHYINDTEEAYTNYFNAYPMNTIKRKEILPEEAIEIIKNAGGIAVIAHPITLKRSNEELEKLLLELKSYGLDGIECYNNIHSQEDIENLTGIAKKLGLLITSGSDFHGPISTPGVELGKGKNNNICNTLDVLENFKSYIEKHHKA